MASLVVSGCFGAPSVGNEPPVAHFSTDRYIAAVGEDINFDANGSMDPEGSIAIYQWNFGDGITGLGVLVQHRYLSPDEYTVTLTVVDLEGAQNSQVGQVTINAPPGAAITVTEGPYFAKEDIGFSGLDSTDPDGRIASYQWTFSDGTTSSQPSVAHQFPDTDTYEASLKVTDNNGATATAELTLFVDIHTYSVSFDQQSQNLQEIRNFSLPNQTKAMTVEIFITNMTEATFTLNWNDIIHPLMGPPNDIFELHVISPEGASFRATGDFNNASVSFNLNPVPGEVQVRAASPGDVPLALGDAYLSTKGTGVWQVEVTAVQLAGGILENGGDFVPEPLMFWTLTISTTSYYAHATEIA
jgi:PKD repeat protein